MNCEFAHTGHFCFMAVSISDRFILRHQIYFEKIHPTTSMIHKFRYLAAMNL